MELTNKIESASNALARVEQIEVDRLSFAFEGIPVQATSSERDGSGEIKVAATLGKLYFTVEKPEQRIMAIERIRAANRGIDGAYRIGRDGTVHFESLTQTPDQLTGEELMTALTLIILEAEPHLRAIQSHLKPT